MRILTSICIALVFAGCAGKIVPGKAPEPTLQKEASTRHAEVQKQPQKAEQKKSSGKVKKPVTETVSEQNVTLIQEVPAEAEEEIFEEKKPSRFANAELISSQPYKVTMKTKKFAFSDTGFMNVYDKLINLQVFSMGKAVLDMTVSLTEDEICVDSLCNTKHGFNQTFLTGVYPDTLVENVLRSRPIFGGKNLKKMTKGFIQKIITPKYAVKYKIWPGNVYFKDSLNHIIIKLRKMPK